jgi:hypothetical protein
MRKIMLLLVVLGLAGSLWAADPQLGTWKLNVAQSKVFQGGPLAKELTVVVRAVGDQIETTLTGTAANGSPISYKIAYPKEGGTEKLVAAEPPSTAGDITRIMTIVSPWEIYGTTLKDGKQQSLSHLIVSKDGKTERVTAKGKGSDGKPIDRLLVFDKQ